MKQITHQEIRSNLVRWIPTGHEVFPDGTELIGKVPHLGPYAWLHELYTSPFEPDYVKLLHYIPEIFDFEIGKLLPTINGMNLFSSHLYVYGLRTSNRRDGSIHQPWEITTHHCEETHKLRGKKAIVIGGSHGLPNGISFVENSDQTVEAFDRNDWSKPMYRWPDLHSFVREEIRRLSLIFNDLGEPSDTKLIVDFRFGV